MSERYELIIKVPLVRAWMGSHVPAPSSVRVFKDVFAPSHHLVLDVGEDCAEMTRHELMSLAAGIQAHFKLEDERARRSAQQGPAPEASTTEGAGDDHGRGIYGDPLAEPFEPSGESAEEVSKVEAGPAPEVDYPLDGNYN